MCQSRRGAALVMLCAFAGAVPAAAPDKPVHVKLLPGGKGREVKPVRAAAVKGRKARVSGVGTLQYDNDIPASRGAGFNVVGNRFDAGFQDPHSIVAMSLRMGGADGGAIVGGLLDVNPTAMTV